MTTSLSSHSPCATELSAAQIEQYHRDGFLAFTDVLSHDEVQQAREGLSALVQRIARDSDVARNGAFWMLPDARCGVQFEPGLVPDGEIGDEELELQVRKLMWFCEVDALFSNLAERHAGIGGVMRSLLGDEPLLYQDMALIKPPFIGSEKPWHQDNAYFSVAPLSAIGGVWIALDEATIDNGCMHVLSGGHHGGARLHHHHRDCEIVPDRIGDGPVVAIELPPGGAPFFSGMLPHFTPPNIGPHRRRALQFHYRAASSTILPHPKYFELFAEADGTPASCEAAHQRI